MEKKDQDFLRFLAAELGSIKGELADLRRDAEALALVASQTDQERKPAA